MKKTASLTLILAVSAILGAQFIVSVEANPFWGLTQYPGEYPAKPSQEFPTIKMDSPKNGEVLATSTSRISFTVTKPNSWDNYWYYLAPMINEPRPVIGSYLVYVYLDGKLVRIMPDPGRRGFPNADYSAGYDKLARGIHNVSVTVCARTLYDDPETDGFLTYPKNITETKQFTINADLPTPIPTAIPEAASRPAFPTTLVSASSVAIALAAIGLLVYLKKR